MNTRLLLLLVSWCAAADAWAASGSLRLLPANPRYFEYRGKPVVLVTSGEHYGAVLNLDFDGRRYLDALSRDGLNLTRTFSGAYVEPAGAFGIAQNTLAPAAGRFVCPWPRSESPGYAGGGNKFDLQRWDEGYFQRLTDFVAHAEKRGVMVEMNLFCPFYEDSQWAISPMNAVNNVNGVGQVARTNVYTLDRNGGLLDVQKAMVRRVVVELNRFPNLYYEICNEPYFGGVTLEWQYAIAREIQSMEEGLDRQHLISRNVANGSERVAEGHPAISILNFHYAHPPDAVAANAHLQCALGDNETGFRGTNDMPYRVEAWSFLLAGGALFNHLDYSFVAGHEDGSFVYPAGQPGGGNATLRRQFRMLAEFMRGFDLARTRPMTGITVEGKGYRAYGLTQTGKAWGVYLGPDLADQPWQQVVPANDQALVVRFELAAGTYRLEWLDPASGETRTSTKVRHDGGRLRLEVPAPRVDAVLRLRK